AASPSVAKPSPQPAPIPLPCLMCVSHLDRCASRPVMHKKSRQSEKPRRLRRLRATLDAMPTLLVLAAGMGSRYAGLKQVEGFGPSGETIMDYSIHDALAAGFDKVVFVIRRDFEAAFRSAVGNKYEGRVEVDYVFQQLDELPPGLAVTPGRTKPWGT